jgi:hypothetical protein
VFGYYTLSAAQGKGKMAARGLLSQKVGGEVTVSETTSAVIPNSESGSNRSFSLAVKSQLGEI